MADTTQTTGDGPTNSGTPVPKWVNAALFEELLKEKVPDFKGIKNFKAYPALSAGENYATLMLRVEIEAELNDEKTKSLTYMLKVGHDMEMLKPVMDKAFGYESQMYLDAVPEFEQLYREVGVAVTFGPKCYRLNTKESHILLEDLRPLGFKNANRLEGLDAEHTKCMLKKLSMWHAASAVRVATKGQYPEALAIGMYDEDFRVFMTQLNAQLAQPYLKCLKTYQGHEVYSESMEKFLANMTDELYKMAAVDPNEFNVLNHGDCWSNNVMYQYDEAGKIKETYFVDYQIPKYGTPAQDLLYFLMSSTKFELKLNQFDFFIKYYHDNLIDNLTVLKYPKKLPTLREIHMMLYRYGIWGLVSATNVMCAVLLDPMETSNMQTFLSENEDGDNLKLRMYSNPRYRKHIEAVLPWLYNRGAMEC